MVFNSNILDVVKINVKMYSGLIISPDMAVGGCLVHGGPIDCGDPYPCKDCGGTFEIPWIGRELFGLGRPVILLSLR